MRPALRPPSCSRRQTDDPPSAEADTQQLRVAGSPSPTAFGDTAARPAATDAPGPLVAEAPVDGDLRASGDTGETAMDDTTFALTLLGIVLAGVGLMVLLLSWLARRWQDPLLR